MQPLKENIPYKILVASMIGNALEQYDFMLYVFIAPLIADVFFPCSDKITSLILSMSVYAVGFISRPLGALFFGYIGDTKGRRIALSLSIFGMAFSTAGMGVIPSYETIGLLAPCLIIFLRLIQSFCVAGEYNGAGLYVLEHTPEFKKNLISGIYTCSGALGMLLASGTLWLVLTYHPHWPQVWRLAFIIPVIFGVVGYYIRRSLTENFPLQNRKKFSLSLKMIFTENLLEFMMVFGISSFSGCLLYFLIALPSAFIPQITLISLKEMNFISFFVLIIYGVNLSIMGFVADRLGSLTIMTGSTLFLIVVSPVLYWYLLSGESINILYSLLILSIFVAAFIAPSHVIMKELFPLHIRYTGISLGFNLGNGLLGATSSAISMFLYKITGNPFSTLFYLWACAALFLSIWTAYTMKLRKQSALLLEHC